MMRAKNHPILLLLLLINVYLYIYILDYNYCCLPMSINVHWIVFAEYGSILSRSDVYNNIYTVYTYTYKQMKTERGREREREREKAVSLMSE